ncbi:MAG: MBL fold metallo-hydrolase [Desulfobacterales bacterium]|nr:MAG: MBL fold metallo-hydrolase [Desulfobacterales bacterium]
MIIGDSGKIIDDLYMVGTPAMPVYLLDGEKPAIFDAGLAFLGRIYTDGIRAILGNRDLHYCFLSHSHFDHCGSVAVLKKSFPTLKVVASEGVKKVLGRPNALALIGELTHAAEKMVKSIGVELAQFDPFEPFEVDVTLKDGQLLELSADVTVHAFETPGHTRDCLSYFILQKKVLFCSEAAGIPDATGYIVSEALVDYDQYFESMRRLSEVEYEVLCLGHRYALTGQDAKKYFQKSMADCRRFLNQVETSLIEEGGDVQKVISRIKAIEYDPVKGLKQIEAAYLLNLEAKVNAIKKRSGNKSENLEYAN